MKLVHECTMNATIAPMVPIGPGPFGNRVYIEVKGGEVTGDRLRGEVVGRALDGFGVVGEHGEELRVLS